MTPAFATAQPEFGPKGSSKITIFSAVVLAVVALVSGTRSFREITSDEPVSTLDVGAARGVHALAGHFAGDSADETLSRAEAFPAVPVEAPATASSLQKVLASVPLVTVQPPVATAEGPQAAKIAAPEASDIPVAHSNVPQMPPAAAYATSRVLPPTAHAGEAQPDPASVVNPENDAVLLDEVRTLERRGDEMMNGKRAEDALDLYATALTSAREYATRKGATPGAKDQVFTLERKLGLLQLQNSSTAEARATYLQARRTLLQIKASGTWSRANAKQLDEIESRLLSLPRD